jgi:hypothetical protein
VASKNPELIMTDKQREIAETVFERNQRRETEINDALKQEYARREAAIKNMYRLRALAPAMPGGGMGGMDY